MDGGGKLLAKAVFAQSRPDVAAAMGNPYWAGSGFGGVVPAGSLSAGGQALSVYAHTRAKAGGTSRSRSPSRRPPPPAQRQPQARRLRRQPERWRAVHCRRREADLDENVGTRNPYTMMGYALDRNAAPPRVWWARASTASRCTSTRKRTTAAHPR